MLELFLDASNIPAEHSIYVSFIVGLMLKFMWVWNLEFHFYDSLHQTNHEDSLYIFPIKRINNNTHINLFLTWFTKCVRKKQNLSDEPDSFSPIHL